MSYHSDPEWQRVEHATYDDDTGVMIYEFAECSQNECEGGLWSDGSDKVCDTCGFSPDNQHATPTLYADRSPFQMGGKRPQYKFERVPVLEGAMGHDVVDIGEFYWPD